MSRYMVAVGAFSWAISVFLVVIGVFYLKDLGIAGITSDHFEIFVGFIGANILGFIIGAKLFSEGSLSYGIEDEADSLISTVSGFSLSAFLSLIILLYLSGSPVVVITISVISIVLTFVGIVLVGRYWNAESAY